MNKCNALRTLGFVAAVLATSSAWSIPVAWAYAVVDLSALGYSFKHLEVTKVSHLSLLNVVAQVPDPSALGLLGLGLVGLGLIRRRRS